ncbi:hypothetical protein D9619_003892 [Psilocybe cf. subviscida]|uniref:F-box domain-containing protein n=1 Tax=Psilocybe cf. subviscida TaxID=2480587 RepID=A0A8H5BQU1_9AGAR|nr:hypothetical protein D9619_003892 [Psilocybe cf. subviscida]
MGSTLDLTSNLPTELYRDIAKNMSQRFDRKTLLSLARVSSDWRHESQRILFSNVHGVLLASIHGYATLDTHTAFLHAVSMQPTRLGAYVRSYSQSNLACNPEAIDEYQKRFWKPNIDLWELTRKALPAMVNLKHFSFSPILRRHRIAEDLLSGCTFRLKTLIWKCEEDSKQTLIAFLRTQPGLLHLEVGEPADNADLSWLPDDVCPNLISVVCSLHYVDAVNRGRNVVALRINGSDSDKPWEALQHSEVQQSHLQRLKYLSLSNSWGACDIFGQTSLNILVLELNYWNIETIQSLIGLPKLRVLVLLANPACEDADFRKEIALCSYRQLPTLEDILLRKWGADGSGEYQYWRISVSQELNGVEAQVVTTAVQLYTTHEIGIMWWAVYDV